jgi:hypothetical protein
MVVRKATRRETALITGASAGIGAELARSFAAAGFDLVLVARNAARLGRLCRALEAEYAVQVRVQPLDLRKPRAARTLAASLRRKRVRVDVLVNNAGIIELGPFAGMRAERCQELIALNVGAATALLSCFLPPMIRRGRGRVLNVCSIASFLPVPTLATYAATKAYLLSLTESLAEELADTGVTVTALCPGITETHMKAVIERAHPRAARLPRILVADAAAVAAEGRDACLRGETIRVPGLVNQLATFSGRTLPRWLVRRVAGVVGRQAV